MDQRPADERDHVGTLSHDRLCGHCGHPVHLIQCDPACDCRETY